VPLVDAAISELLPPSCSFEGLRAIEEVLLLNDQAPSELEELKNRLAYGHAAARPASPLPSPDEKQVPAAVQDLLRLPPESRECIQPISPQPQVPVVTVENWLQVGRHEIYAGPIFDAGIEAEENHIEVSAVTRRVS
jgi:hypothetical protein